MIIDLHIKTPVFHPQDRYGWKTNEIGIGLAEFRLKNKYHLWIRIGKDDKFLYLFDVINIKKFIKEYKKSVDNIKGHKILMLPTEEWGKELKLYKRYRIGKKLKEMHDKEQYYYNNDLPFRW